MSGMGIGTKILLMVGLIFLLFSIGLVTMIGATSFNNLTQVKHAELTRTSQVLTSQIAQMERNAALVARRFEESEPIVSELQLMTELGPYYTAPGSYFGADFRGDGGEIENADQIYLFQSQIKLIQLLLPLRQINNFSSIRFYQISPFDVVDDAPPARLLHLDHEVISVTRFRHKGKQGLPRSYSIRTADFRPPEPNYFGISSAYAFPPDDFYRENRFQLDDDEVVYENFQQNRFVIDRPQSEFVVQNGVPVLQTWYPVRVLLAHPETWEEAMVPVGIVQITQEFDSAAMALLSEQLGLDIALALDNQLLISSLGEVVANTQRLDSAATLTIDQNEYNYAWKPVRFGDQAAQESADGIDTTALQAIVLSPVSELAILTDAQRQQIVQLASITVLLAGILLYLGLLYLLNRPLGALMDGVQRISRGELSHLVNVTSKDEVGQLAVAFNGMAGQVRDLIGSLEQRVADRTRELTEANQAAEIARQKAEKANQAKSEFLSQMSHELRTPLNGILGYTQILRKNRELNTQQLNGLTVIQQSGEHLLTLINDILDLAKIEAQKMELFPTDVYLPSFLDALVRIFRVRAEQKGLTFVYEPLETPNCTIRIDEKRLRQIVINLLSNAIRYTEEGSIHFSIVLLAPYTSPAKNSGNGIPSDEQPSKTVTLRFAVKDTGVGMTVQEMEHLFTPFEQLGGPGQRTKGTGLGLAISQNLARMLGSQIKVESDRGRGSLFWFDLTAPLLFNAPPDPQPPERTIVGYHGKARTILVVDDNRINRRLIVDLLTPLGFTVNEAADGRQAVEMAERNRPDLILMDLRMAGVSGLDATRSIRRRLLDKERNGKNSFQKSANRTVIIAASASAFESDRTESLEAGCDGFLAKPVQPSALLALLEEHLTLRWIYEDDPLSNKSESLTKTVESAFDADINTLIVPPPAEMVVLLELAQRGMMRNIREKAEELITLDADYRPFAEKVSLLAQNFQEKELLAFIQEFQSGED